MTRIPSTAEAQRAAFAGIPVTPTPTTASNMARGAITAIASIRRTRSCATCSTSDYEYAGHSFTYGKWSSVSDTQHKRTKTCSVCKASGEEYADHVDANGDGKCDDCGATVR